MLLVPPLILLVAILAVSSRTKADGRSRLLLGVLTVLFVLSIAPAVYFFVGMWMVYKRDVGNGDARQEWARHAAEYRSAEALFKKHAEGEFPLPQELKALSMDGNVSIDLEEGTRLTTFVLDKWGIDNSIAIVRIEGEPPASSKTLEKWFRTDKLADGWFLVEGT